ncbi:hypothetical protein [Candidatus Viridilinea mediisalina]|nr:hypothetical protein [Candidatus Viridilinea mediisalina]
MPHYQERYSPLGRHVRQSTIYNLQSAICNLQSTMGLLRIIQRH